MYSVCYLLFYFLNIKAVSKQAGRIYNSFILCLWRAPLENGQVQSFSGLDASEFVVRNWLVEYFTCQ